MAIKFILPWFIKDEKVMKILEDQFEIFKIYSHQNEKLEDFPLKITPLDYRNHLTIKKIQSAWAYKIEAVEGIFLFIIYSSFSYDWKVRGDYICECFTKNDFLKEDNDLVIATTLILDRWSWKMLNAKKGESNE